MLMDLFNLAIFLFSKKSNGKKNKKWVFVDKCVLSGILNRWGSWWNKNHYLNQSCDLGWQQKGSLEEMMMMMVLILSPPTSWPSSCITCLSLLMTMHHIQYYTTIVMGSTANYWFFDFFAIWKKNFSLPFVYPLHRSNWSHLKHPSGDQCSYEFFCTADSCLCIKILDLYVMLCHSWWWWWVIPFAPFARQNSPLEPHHPFLNTHPHISFFPPSPWPKLL